MRVPELQTREQGPPMRAPVLFVGTIVIINFLLTGAVLVNNNSLEILLI
jgi:hypothetical protein